jgi:hypothetical protein
MTALVCQSVRVATGYRPSSLEQSGLWPLPGWGCSRMAGDSVTLVLNGTPTLDELAEAAGSLRDLLAALTEERAGKGERIEWVVDALEVSSSLMSVKGSGRLPLVEAVSAAYLDVGRSIQRDVWDTLAPTVARPARSMLRIINGHVPSIRFENADDDVTIVPAGGPERPDIAPIDIPGAYGAVLGRIQTLSSRGSLRFTLYDLLHNKAVSCYLRADQQDMIRDAWDRIALVRGWIKRDAATGRPLTIRRVRGVELRHEGVPGEWRQAAGALDHPDADWSAIVRRLRDAQ